LKTGDCLNRIANWHAIAWSNNCILAGEVIAVSSLNSCGWVVLNFFNEGEMIVECFSFNPLKPCCLFVLSLLLSGLVVPPCVLAQNPKPIYDGRLALGSTKLSSSEDALVKEKILPAAQKRWHEDESDQGCIEGLNSGAIDMARGSFTKPNSDQRAILYTYCSTGHNMALNGIAIIENDKVVSHIVYEGGWDSAIGALPDINGNGRSEILVASGGTNQGQTWRSISIIELSDTIVLTKFGMTGVFSDNCGAVEKNCKVEAYRISVKSGGTPVFYREAFVNGGSGKESGWKKSDALKRISLENDELEYEFVK
jgi:hypothetical protein